jgi:aryl-alcohol dehydrogenase-like predicted oxidoreductase
LERVYQVDATNIVEKHTFGQTDMLVSTLGLGGQELGNLSDEDARLLINQILDAGINVIDTAECYGRSEELIGRAAASRREQYYIFTKCGHANADEADLPDWHPHLLERNIERSLRRLQTDHIDLIQLHSCSLQTLQQGAVIEVLQRARQAGKVRYIGYSGDREAARYAVTCGAFDALQTSINMADQEAIDVLLPQARARRIGIIAKRSLANAAWDAQHREADPIADGYWHRLQKLDYAFLKQSPAEIASIALRFTASVLGIDIINVGITNPGRIQQNLAVLAEGPLPEPLYNSMRSRWRTVTRWRKFLPGGHRGWHAWV